MKIQTLAKRTLLGLVGAAAITASIGAPALAADTVTQVINGNNVLTASVADASMTAVSYSNTAVTTTGSLTLSVDDQRGTSEGWHVTIASTDFVYGGTSTIGEDIDNAGFAITSLGTPASTAGQPVVSAGPNAVSGGAASLDTARETIEAGVGSGSGQYTQALPVSLDVPAYSQAGTYTATLTVTIVSGP